MKKNNCILTGLFLLFQTLYIGKLNAQTCFVCPGNTGTTGINASAFGSNNAATGLNSIAFGNGNISNGENAASFGYQSEAWGLNSIAFGYKAKVYGTRGVSIGENSFSVEQSYSVGQYAKANIGQSFAIGRFVETNASGAFVLGSSISGYSLINSNPNSLIIGFNSTVPTLFIGPSVSNTGIGKVGIGTTTPQADLHIKSMDNTDASLFVQPGSWNSASKAILSLGNSSNGLIADITSGLTFRTQKHYIFNQGNVGIGTSNPQAKLHVDRGNTILNGNLQVGNREQDITSTIFGRLGIGTEKPAALLHVEKGSTLLNGDVQIGSKEGLVVASVYGKLGIGTSNPLADLQVEGSVSIGFSTHTPPGSTGLIVNGPVGIGTFAPTVPLEVVGKIKTTELQLSTGYMNGYILQSDQNGNAHWVNPTTVNTGIWIQNGLNISVDNTKKVGIGTATPAEALDLKGNMLCSGNIKGGRTDWQPFQIFANSSETDGSSILMSNNNDQAGSIKFYSTGTSGRIEFHNQNIQVMSIRGDNNVYFGDPETNTNIYVNGEITSSLVRVNTQEWWDCVFKNDYQLKPLAEVEDYINKHQHLPDIPSENEMKANGIDVAQMNALLLKKIEELTLYVIELEKRVEVISK